MSESRVADPLDERRLLIVDDDEVDRRDLRRKIERMGRLDWHITEVQNGRDALDRLQDLEPDLIFLDYRMPDMDGLEVLRELRVLLAHRMPHVVAVTGAGSEEVARRLFLLGVTDYLMKAGIAPGSVYRLLELAARGAGRPRLAERPMASQQQPLATLSGSQGALPGCIDILAALPENPPFGLFSIVHSSQEAVPDRLLSVLDKRRRGNIRWADQGCQPEPGLAHVARPSGDAGLVRGRFQASPLPNFPAPVPSIDIALRSTAASQGSELVSVHLSGMGEDGVRGARAVRERGGENWIQDPEEAESPSIPLAIKHAGLADRVLGTADIAPALLEYFRT